jgi:predicted GIY-YIG superfamily endonuclease
LIRKGVSINITGDGTAQQRAYAPFLLIYSQVFPTREEARKREKYLKSEAGKGFLRGLIDK